MEISEIGNIKMTEKIDEITRLFIENISSTKKPLVQLMRKKKQERKYKSAILGLKEVTSLQILTDTKRINKTIL